MTSIAGFFAGLPSNPVAHPLCGTVELLRQYLDKQNGPVSDNICFRSSRQRFRNDRIDEVERAKNRTKAKVRSKVEHVLAVMKLKFGFMKVRYRGIAKNANRLFAVPRQRKWDSLTTERWAVQAETGAPQSRISGVSSRRG